LRAAPAGHSSGSARPRSGAPHDAAAVRGLLAGEISLSRLLFRAARRRPGPVLGGAAAMVAVAAVLVNAMALQEGRHPAPMFEGRPQIRQEPVPATVQLPPPRNQLDAERLKRQALTREVQEELARRGFYHGPVDAVGGPRTEAAIRDYEAAAGLARTGEPSDALLAHLLTSKVRPRDGIAQLLRQSAVEERPDRVQQMQRALNRLGYGPLKEDGAIGAGTRAAIERFERDRKLAVRGEASGPTLRELAQASGMAIE
jgi:peptidoglycan hydrolase-like protein with peptidoglycan-binding domain